MERKVKFKIKVSPYFPNYTKYKALAFACYEAIFTSPRTYEQIKQKNGVICIGFIDDSVKDRAYGAPSFLADIDLSTKGWNIFTIKDVEETEKEEEVE